MSAAVFFAELIRTQGGFRPEIAPFRPKSPKNRPAETQAGRGVSPNSPLSPLTEPGGTKSPPADLDTLAASIAAEFQVSAAAVMGLLDDDDREAIRTGSDPGRADAWRAAVASLIHRGEWKPAPEQVTCSDCRHAQPAAPGLIDCAAQVRAPGACGPFRWWATDRHICESWEAWP